MATKRIFNYFLPEELKLDYLTLLRGRVLIVGNFVLAAFSILYYLRGFLLTESTDSIGNYTSFIFLFISLIVFVVLKKASVNIAAYVLVSALIITEAALAVTDAGLSHSFNAYIDEFYFLLLFLVLGSVFGSRFFLLISWSFVAVAAFFVYYAGINNASGYLNSASLTAFVNFEFVLAGMLFIVLSIRYITYKAIGRSEQKAAESKEKTRELCDLIDTFEETSEKIMTHTDSLYSSAFELNESSANQAMYISDMTKAIKSLTVSITDNAEMAKSQGSEAEKSKDNVNRTVEVLKRITDSVGDLRSQIDSIDYISFQSNILSLNAAIQASKFGEAGKGFTAIADEVRYLSKNSKEANKTIAEISERNTQNADEAAMVVRELEKVISGSISGNRVIFEKISDQKFALDTLNDFAEEINKYAQTNAGISNKFSRSAKDLIKSLRRLNKLIFKTRMQAD
jgi:methyl-accepting chemotaxis protein